MEQNVRLCFESYGVGFQINVSDQIIADKILKRLRLVFAENLSIVESSGDCLAFSVVKADDGSVVISETGEGRELRFNPEDVAARFESLVRIRVAENAESRVFVHAGVVARNGRAIVLPGKSFTGKTTMVKELVRLGAEYYSDEYAVLDEDGFVHPFAKPLSVRSGDGGSRQIDVSVETLGGRAGRTKIPCGLVFVTEFRDGAGGPPTLLSKGQGILEILANTVPVRRNPAFSLKVLNKLTRRAIIAKCFRGEAKTFAHTILECFDKHIGSPPQTTI